MKDGGWYNQASCSLPITTITALFGDRRHSDPFLK
jgi:hypothetical protein